MRGCSCLTAALITNFAEEPFSVPLFLRGHLLLKSPIELLHSILLHRRQHMRINVHRHTDFAMAQYLLYYFRMHTHTEEQSSRTVPQIMKSYVGQASLFQQYL